MSKSKNIFLIKIVAILQNNTDLFNKFQSLQACLKTAIEESKQKYYSCLSDKLLDSKTSPKLYY